ncbi:MAG: molybdopterin-dependent oxidoreductase [Proteobacteria bacterium]|nr:molybdopterin-dependent oxidoreductase [Pseudomonadota bacterium]
MKKYDTVHKSACRMCHGGCGVHVYVKDGKVVRIKGDPESPLNRGKMCIKGLSSIEHLYHPDRLKYPLKRQGKRGEGKWQRISWDEALDTVVENLNRIRENHGTEAIAIGQGTGRHHFNHVVRFANALGTPNWFEPGTAQCFLPRIYTGIMTYGGLPICDYYGETNPACVLVWGHNPTHSGPDGELQFRINDCLKRGTKLIVIDPRKTDLAAKADIWLRIRPGTDDALALSMLNVIIGENLYDSEFVENWTTGFEQLKERVANFPPEWAEPITWIPADGIRQAARAFARTRPGVLEWGCALEHTPNCLQTVRAISLLPGLTGNIDVPGGMILGMHIVPEASHLREKLPLEQLDRQLGADRFKVLSGRKSFMPSAHIPTVLQAMRTGKPYPVKAFLAFGSNSLVSYGNVKQVYESLMQLDFMLSMDLYSTPTTELADIVLPAASWLELDELFGAPFISPHVALVQQKIVRTGECRSDEEVFIDLARRLNLESGTDPLEDIFRQQLAGTAQNYPEFEGITFDDVKEKGFITVPIQYKKHEKRGFGTRSGKVELASSYLENLGYDPLPYYVEPPESPISTPELAREYPLVLTTGGRLKYFFCSEFRQVPSLRKKHPDPLVELHPETAEGHGIQEGDWVWIETRRGQIQQKAKITMDIDPRVINVQYGWWFPEETPPEYGVWKSNANVLTSNEPPYDPAMGTYQLRALLCRIRKA